MNSKIFFDKSTYLYYLLIILLIVGSIYILSTTKKLSSNVAQINFNAATAYAEDISSNIAELIKSRTGGEIVESLKKSESLRSELNSHLSLFISKRYRYVYVVRKKEKGDRFEFLLDGAKKERSEFLESFQPANPAKWLEVYKTKKPLYFKHKDIKSLWLTYLRPIVTNNRVEAIVVIDFSLQEYHYIQEALKDLSKIIELFMFFLLLIFVFVSILGYIDRKKIALIEAQAQEIQNFNLNLQKRVEEEVRKNREKDKLLLEQSRLAQMGEMIGMIAHQWRQPISTISATSMELSMKAQLQQLNTEEAIKIANRISELTQHLSATIEDFRNFFKPTKEKKDITYADLIDSTLSIVETSLKSKNIKVVTEIRSDVVFHTYANELKQVLLNLIKNAEDVLVERKVKDPCIKIIAEGNTLSVSDNAGGIPQENIAKIFDPYFSTKGLNGTGLGLYMSKTIIHEHCGGTLSVKNDEEGAVFTITLPLGDAQEEVA